MALNNITSFDLTLKVSEQNKIYHIQALSKCLEKTAEASLPNSEVEDYLIPKAEQMQQNPLPPGENQEFGSRLFNALIRDNVRDLYRSIEGMNIRGLGFQLALNLEPHSLQRLPWECMFDPFWERFLSLQTDTHIVRIVDRKQEDRLKPGELEYTNLVIAIANARKLLPIDPQETEKEYIDQAIGDLSSTRKLNYRFIQGNQSEIHKVLSSASLPDVFHFIGHGGMKKDTPGLYLEDANGDAIFEDATALENNYFTPSPRSDRHVRMVILSACETAETPKTAGYTSLAHRLARQVDAVLAMQFPIGLENMKDFNFAFYHALANGETLEASVNAARRAIIHDKMGITREWIAPVLVLPRDTSRNLLQLVRQNPFKGPLYYDITDSQRFFGRDNELQKLGALYRDKSIIVINGETGCGKTSLLKAGLMAELQGDKQPVIYISLSENLENQLHTEINSLLVNGQQMPLPEGDIASLTGQFPRDLTIILDRVEQIEHLGEQISQIVTALITWISDSSQDGGRPRLVIATRLNEQGKEPELLTQQIPDRECRLPLDMLAYDRAYQWIEAVTQKSAVTFPRETITAILNGLNYQDPEKQSMMALQVVCSALFDRALELRRKEATPELLTDKELADIDGILEQVFANKLDNNKYKQGDTAKKVLAQFVSSDRESMRPRSLRELRLRCKLGDKELKEILDQLQEDGLLRLEQQPVEEKFELVHETLVKTLVKILGEDGKWPSEEEIALRKLEEIIESAHTLIPLKSEKGGLEDLDERCDDLTLSNAQLELLLRSALEAGHKADYWFERIQDPKLSFSVLTSSYLSVQAQERACHLLEKMGARQDEYGKKAQEILLEWACTGESPRINQAASLALAPLTDQSFIDQHFGGRRDRLKNGEVAALAVMHDAHRLPLKGLASSVRRQIYRKILNDNSIELLSSVLRAACLGAVGLGLAVDWIYAQVYTSPALSSLPPLPALLLEFSLMGLLAFILALPGALCTPLGRDLFSLLSGGRRNLPAALGTILGSTLGTGLTVVLLAALAEYRDQNLMRLVRYFLAAAVWGAAIALPWLLAVRFSLKPIWTVLLAGLCAAFVFLGVSQLDAWWPQTSFMLTLDGRYGWGTRLVPGILVGLGSGVGLVWGQLRKRP
jgi:CHAT domain-containing protein